MPNQPKEDLSISMLRANMIAFIIALPIAILQIGGFYGIHGAEAMSPTWPFLLFVLLLIASIFIHELIHGLTWAITAKKPFSSVEYGIQWKMLTPFAHLKETVDISAYRMGGLMPGLVLGIIPYIFSLILGDGNLLWFGIIHTIAASGDWQVLWLIRKVRHGSQVEDHPTRAGCYVIAP